MRDPAKLNQNAFEYLLSASKVEKMLLMNQSKDTKIIHLFTEINSHYPSIPDTSSHDRQHSTSQMTVSGGKANNSIHFKNIDGKPVTSYA